MSKYEQARNELGHIWLAEQPMNAPANAGYWMVSRRDLGRFAKLRNETAGDLVKLPQKPEQPKRIFGLPVITMDADEPPRFVLWCPQCDFWVRWDGTGQCQTCHGYLPGAEHIRFVDMLKAARERWPEMTEQPQIVDASPGSNGLDMVLYDGIPLTADLPDRLLEERPPLKFEHIALEPVGPYRLGYGPLSRTLYVGQEPQP